MFTRRNINAVTGRKNELLMPEDVDVDDETDITDNLSKEKMETRVEKCLSRLPTLYYEPPVLFLSKKSHTKKSATPCGCRWERSERELTAPKHCEAYHTSRVSARVSAEAERH